MASKSQAEAVDQISRGVSQIAVVVEVNSEASHKSAASSQELSALATQLKALLEQFKFH